MCIRLIVYVKKTIYDDIIIANNYLIKTETDVVNIKPIVAVRLNKKGFNAYVASAYIATMKLSNLYRQSAIKPLISLLNSNNTSENTQPVIFLRLRMPRKQFLDYKWGERMKSMALERREIDYAMSWLSTLGGAFSAMGDQFNRCAKVAGKISIEQFKLALRLGDPLLVARCHLYASLSLIQQEKFKIPRTIIPRIYQFAIKSKDKHLERMCQGIWAKLKYSIHLKKQNKIELNIQQ